MSLTQLEKILAIMLEVLSLSDWSNKTNSITNPGFGSGGLCTLALAGI